MGIIKKTTASSSTSSVIEQDLTVKFASEIAEYSDAWAWIKARIQAGEFNGINIGDYIPFSTSAGTVEGSAVDAQDFKAEVAGINLYYGTPSTSDYHIDFITRDCFNKKIQWKTNNNNNGTSVQNCPWKASKIYAVLNGINNYTTSAYNSEAHGYDASAGGVYQLLPTELQNVIIGKETFLESKYSASTYVTGATAYISGSAGNLWLPTGFEVYGYLTTSSLLTAPNLVQYPIFMGLLPHNSRCKTIPTSDGLGVGWWTSATANASYLNAVAVTADAIPSGVTCSTGQYVPICFRVG